MTKQVLINVKGLQFAETEAADVEAIELITVGSYYCRDGDKYIKYEESFEGVEGTAKNLIKIKDGVLEIRKKGIIEVHMVFEKEKKNLSYYTTPYGTIRLGIATTRLNIIEEQDSLDIRIDYVLEMNDEYVADCTLSLSATVMNHTN
jgi:Uncharacterized protein conserved in bacteria